MQMETVKVVKAHPYGREMRRPGQICLIEKKYAEILALAGLVVVTEEAIVKRPLPVQTRRMDVQDDPEASPKKKRRTYRRMDLRAEE